jgi:DNA-binding winged helix-turn-helix (wHTH) protein
VPSAYCFGPFRLDAASYRLHRDDAVVPLSAKLIDLLLYFVTHPSRLVSKEELFAAMWPDVTVTDNALTQAISDLRHALGDHPSAPQYIQTVARRGYRFVAPVATEETASTAPEVQASSHETASLEAYRAYTEGRLKLEALRGSDRAATVFARLAARAR